MKVLQNYLYLKAYILLCPMGFPVKGRLSSLNLLIFIAKFLLVTNFVKVDDKMMKL